MIRCAAPARAGSLSHQHDPYTSPLRTRPPPLPRQGVATPAARPAAAHLTHRLSWSGPSVAHSRSGARCYLSEGTSEAPLVAEGDTRLLGAPGWRRAPGLLTVPGRSRPLSARTRELAIGGRAGARSPSNGKTRSRSNWPNPNPPQARSGGASGFSFQSSCCLRRFLQPAGGLRQFPAGPTLHRLSSGRRTVSSGRWPVTYRQRFQKIPDGRAPYITG